MQLKFEMFIKSQPIKRKRTEYDQFLNTFQILFDKEMSDFEIIKSINITNGSQMKKNCENMQI